MVSGVSFKQVSPTNKNLRKKKSATRGLIVLFIGIALSVGVYALIFIGHKNEQETHENYIAQQSQNESRIQELLQGEQAKTLVRIRAIDTYLYAGNTTQHMLQKCEKLLVPGIVFASFEHSYDSTEKVSAVSISGDADTFDVLATQVARWEESGDFISVTISSTERDAETGRVLFSAMLESSTSKEGGAVRALWSE